MIPMSEPLYVPTTAYRYLNAENITSNRTKPRSVFTSRDPDRLHVGAMRSALHSKRGACVQSPPGCAGANVAVLKSSELTTVYFLYPPRIIATHAYLVLEPDAPRTDNTPCQR